MRIKEVISQNRRDMQNLYECEHCGHTHKDSGYDDENFHKNVVPKMICPDCKKIAKDNSDARTPKYESHVII